MIRGVAACLFVVAVILSSIAPILSGARFAFRDVSHFYLPLYDYIGQRNRAEWVPLWNPLDHLGMPLLGETSTAVLYPIRFLVYQLPVASEASLNIYLALHLMVAAAGAGWLAKRIGCTPLGTVAAAILYPLSGSVFSLVTNPPFLVGAAWLPIVLASCLGDPISTTRSESLWRSMVIAAIGLAMMVLGGDPQTALHSVLVIGAISATRWLLAWRKGANAEEKQHHFARNSLAVMLGGGCLAVAIGAVQIAASYDWSRQSDRVLNRSVRSDVYDFSLGPWHVMELVSARPLGHPFPVNRWLAKLIPAEGRMWTPSIYGGFVVGFALLCRLFKPESYFVEPWFAVAVISLLLCFGHYGLIWWLQQIPGVSLSLPSAAGGPYWILCNVLPGYDSFRYPIKWLPVFSLASTMVTAQWLGTEPGRHERRLVFAMAVVGVGAVFVSHYLMQRHPTDRTLFGGQLPVDEYWGPLDAIRGFALSRASWLLSLLALIALAKLRFQVVRQDGGTKRLRFAIAWLLLIGVDGALNARFLIPTIDIAREHALVDEADAIDLQADRTLRTQSGLWPDRWRKSQSFERALVVAASERIAWFGRWHLPQHHAIFNSMCSIRSARYADFWRWVDQEIAARDQRAQNQFWTIAGQWLGIDSVSHVDEQFATAVDGLSLVYVKRWKVESVEPARAFYRWKPMAPLEEILAEMVRTGRPPLPHVPVTPPSNQAATPTSNRPLVEAQDETTYRVECDRPCIIERSVLQDGNWSAELLAEDTGVEYLAAVVPSSHLNQAVWIPRPGRWRVRFVYRPAWLGPTIAISGFGIAVCALLLAAPWIVASQNLGRLRRVR